MNSRPLTLCVLVESFGWELAKRSPFLDDLLVHKSHLGTVFGPGPGGEPTVLTGRLPREHGQFAHFVFDPIHSPFRFPPLRWVLASPLGRNEKLRPWINRFLRRWLDYKGRFDLYNLPLHLLHLMDSTEKHDFHHRAGIHGDCPTVFDTLKEKGVPYVRSELHRSEAENLAAITNGVATGKPVLAYLMLPELKFTLRSGGTKAPGVAAKLGWYEQQLREVCRVASARYDGLRLFVFSTHGISDVTGQCDLMSRIEATGLKFGTDYGAVYSPTLARFWILRAGVQERIRQALAAESAGRVITDVELAAWGADFPDRRYGELFFLLNPGILLCPSFVSAAPMAAMHGYAPQHAGSVAAFMSNAKPAKPPRRLDDLHDLILDAVEHI